MKSCCAGLFMKSTVHQEPHLVIEDLPVIVTGKILSYIPWYDKMNIQKCCPEASSYLHIPCAWSRVFFNDMRVFTDKMRKKHRKEFERCLSQFGRYMKTIELRFACQINKYCWPLLCAISENCSNLVTLKVKVSTNFSAIWKQPVVSRMCDIMEKCENLTAVHLVNPVIHWGNGCKDNMLIQIYSRGLSHKISELSIPNCSLLKHHGPLSVDFAASMVCLRKLLIKREAIGGEALMVMVCNGLKQLTLFYDREIEEESEIQPQVWNDVLKVCPLFKVDLIIENILIRKELFPEQMPVRSVEFGKCEYISPTDINHLTTCYKATLECFGYTNFFRGKGGSESIPPVLYDMVKKCHMLRKIRYGFPIPSTIVLLIARTRRLEAFEISNDDIIYNRKITVTEEVLKNCSPKCLQWLGKNSISKETLSSAMTELFGHTWKPLNYLIFDASQLLAH